VLVLLALSLRCERGECLAKLSDLLWGRLQNIPSTI